MNEMLYDKKPLRTFKSLLSFALICLFALFSILLVVLGAQAYKKVTENATSNFEIRTSIGYIQGKLRAHDGLGPVNIEKKDGICLLSLEQEIDGEKYKTLIYCYQGTLYEMLVAAETEFHPDQGNILTALNGFDIEMTEYGYTITVLDTSNRRHSQFVAKYSI